MSSLVCDKCGKGNASRVTFITEEGRASFDLCSRCLKPIKEILDLLAKAPARRTGRPSGLIKSQTAKVYDDPKQIPGKRRGGNPRQSAPMRGK